MYNWKHLWWNPINKRVAGLIAAPLMLLLAGCKGSDSKGDPLMDILDSKDSAISRVMQNPGDYEIQIRYTRIARTGDSARFTHYSYGIDEDQYFYCLLYTSDAADDNRVV